MVCSCRSEALSLGLLEESLNRFPCLYRFFFKSHLFSTFKNGKLIYLWIAQHPPEVPHDSWGSGRLWEPLATCFPDSFLPGPWMQPPWTSGSFWRCQAVVYRIPHAEHFAFPGASLPTPSSQRHALILQNPAPMARETSGQVDVGAVHWVPLRPQATCLRA